MTFEWDEHKRTRNLEEHGLDFIDVIPCFTDERRVVAEDRRTDYWEQCFHLLCPLRQRIYHVTFTERGANIRIISARKANRREQRYYAEQRRKDH
jgi:uncharacterized protein